MLGALCTPALNEFIGGTPLCFDFVSKTDAELAKMSSQKYFSLQISINVTAFHGLP